MSLTISSEPVPLRLDQGGTYRVGGTRVRLDTVIFAYNSGSPAEQIAREYSLEPADVHFVIGYYLNHRAEVDAYLAARRDEAERLRAEIESQPQNEHLRETIAARWKNRQHRE